MRICRCKRSVSLGASLPFVDTALLATYSGIHLWRRVLDLELGVRTNTKKPPKLHLTNNLSVSLSASKVANTSECHTEF